MARIGATKNVKKQGLRALTLFLPIITLHLAGCATTTRTPLTYLGHYQIQAPKVDGFVACKSYGCKKKSWLTYTTEEWQEISSIFETTPVNAAQERERIRVAIGRMNKSSGPKTTQLETIRAIRTWVPAAISSTVLPKPQTLLSAYYYLKKKAYFASTKPATHSIAAYYISNPHTIPPPSLNSPMRPTTPWIPGFTRAVKCQKS